MVYGQKNIVNIINKGSMKEDLQSVGLDIYKLSLVNGISLEMDWIPRSRNDKADVISNLNDVDDWGVSNQIFDYFNSLWGPFEVDWFASDSNSKRIRFLGV